MKKYLSLLFRTVSFFIPVSLLFAVLLFLCMAVIAPLLNHTSQSAGSGAVSALLLYALLNAAVIVLWFENTRLKGVRLFAVSFLLFWGVQYFMTQIETLFFNSSVKMPIPELIRVMVSGAVYIAAFLLLSLLVWKLLFKKFHSDTAVQSCPAGMSLRDLLPRMAVLTLLYVILYFFFGYFVAWQFAAIRQFYSGSTKLISFWQDMAGQDPVLVLFQVFRGILWALLSLLIQLSISKEKHAAAILLPGLLFSIFITTPLLFPNAYMPDAVRFGHSLELSSSMFVYGVAGAAILHQKKLL